MAGASLQGMFANPLVSSDILGYRQGRALVLLWGLSGGNGLTDADDGIVGWVIGDLLVALWWAGEQGRFLCWCLLGSSSRRSFRRLFP